MGTPVFYWLLSCPFGCSLRVESPTTTPPMDLYAVRCAYHDIPMQNFKPVDVKS